MKELMKD
jgi:hypothetical protein